MVTLWSGLISFVIIALVPVDIREAPYAATVPTTIGEQSSTITTFHLPL
jgi:hypothetical protein